MNHTHSALVLTNYLSANRAAGDGYVRYVLPNKVLEAMAALATENPKALANMLNKHVKSRSGRQSS